MKKEEIKKWREANEKEIGDKVVEIEKQLYEIKHQLSLGQIKNYSQIKEIKKDIARLKTISKEKKWVEK